MDAKRNNAKGSQPSGKAMQMEGADLESVIQRAQGHDAEALGEIYRLYGRRVFGLCRYILGSRESAEDATSEAFLKLQRSIESYDGSTPFHKWLLRVAGNQCIDALRRQNRERQAIVEVEDPAAVIEAVSSEPSPLGAVLNAEERTNVRDAIGRLPENYRVPRPGTTARSGRCYGCPCSSLCLGLPCYLRTKYPVMRGWHCLSFTPCY
jgi:RNA polymerase sigma-70 factor (ECF subfamily)